MTGLEKVIRGLECCTRERECTKCPYCPDIDNPETLCDLMVMEDALALLKEEPIEPIAERINELDSLFRCRGCGAYVIFRKQRYCHACGREVKWDG